MTKCSTGIFIYPFFSPLKVQFTKLILIRWYFILLCFGILSTDLNLKLKNVYGRMLLSPLGGIELDYEGVRKKRWLWYEPMEHIHAPPFQPIIFALNNYVSVKVFNQEKINIQFCAEQQTYRFRVGSRIKISRPEVMSNNFKVDNNEMFLKKKRSRIE